MFAEEITALKAALKVAIEKTDYVAIRELTGALSVLVNLDYPLDK